MSVHANNHSNILRQEQTNKVAIRAFQSFIDMELTVNPEIIIPLEQTEMDEIAELVAGVNID